MTDCSSRRSWISLKAEAARSEQEGVGTPDYESLFSMEWSRVLVHEIYINDFLIISAIPFNISAILQLYRRFHPIYQRFSQYIDLPTNHDNISTPLPYFHQYITISFMLKYSNIDPKKLFHIHHLLLKWREWFS